jgi:membrane associated rhomboid family serine protease
MHIFNKFPYATVALSVAILVLYWMLAADTPYITDENLGDFALTQSHPFSIVSHLFIHVGIYHLIGNLIPLIFFGLALEMALGSIDVALIFLLSGTLSSLLFAVLNPGIPLIGASAGISGMLAAVLLTKPKTALALLIATPILVSLVFFPVADIASKYYEEKIIEQKIIAEENLQQAIEQNQSPQIISQINRTLVQTDEKIDITFQGKEREEKTPTDFLVHIYGAIIGGFYIYFMKRKHLKNAEHEFVHIGGFIFHKLDRINRWFKRH